MHVDVAPGAVHLLRAARDAALSDVEIERRVAAKNAVVARALREQRLSLADAENLLYDAELRDDLLARRPTCGIAALILRLGCSLATLEDRLLKWSPELPRARAERIGLLVACSDRVLAPEALIEALRRRPTLSIEELDLTAPLRDPRLVPVLVRTLLADTTAWTQEARAAFQERVLAALGNRAGRGTPAAWRAWWQREGRFAYPDPVDALPDTVPALAPPVALLPEGGGEYTLESPLPFYYVGRHLGRAEVFYLRPRERGAGSWRTCLARAAEALLAGSAPVPEEYEGACGLDGGPVHATGPGEAIRVSIPDPGRPIAWLACSECGQSGYVRYSLDPDALPVSGSIG
jgi:hypothetical protein